MTNRRVGSETARAIWLMIYGPCGGEVNPELARLIEAHDAQLVADLTKPSPCEKPGHRMADCRPATLADNSENEFVCTLCEREEREKAIAVGAALEDLAVNFCHWCLAGESHTEHSVLSVKIRERIPEASKKALADERERLIADLESMLKEWETGPDHDDWRARWDYTDELRALIARYKAPGGNVQDGPKV